MDKLGVISSYRDLVEAPPTCEIAIRVKEGKRFLFLLNYSKEAAEIVLKQEGRNLYNDEIIKGNYRLPEYGTLVIEI